MSKIYDLYSSDQRKIDNWRRRIIGYEKMKRDNQREMHKLRKQRDLYKEVINEVRKALEDYQEYIDEAKEFYSDLDDDDVVKVSNLQILNNQMVRNYDLLQILDKGEKNEQGNMETS